MLHLHRFRKAYAGHPVLTVDELRIPPGIYWLRGSNGAGKSTLLQALAGIIACEGEVTLNGHLTLRQQPAAYRRAVNFAEAEPLFPEFLTGHELIQLFKTAKGAPSGQEQPYVTSMGMAEYLHEPIGTYSSGMVKKLSLLLAFLGRPACILLDEPLTTLDAASLPILYDWIAAQHAQHGTTFLLSSHHAFAGGRLPGVREIILEHATLRLPA
ncbi:ABC transporter ATP-binding protein [Hymenobacter sp. 15J16-1T3B]|uniref:ABC transporter ATP-binding protein n=1 Tax=Hymenobacter sp. 15J16-1T3B TaxID=2886941 RepID=UPI001D123274|nr:ABC transporter ATP-binding protein [Hymenobacter sp. 15J16-1T3B]MCC3157074.1 ABC transporter ATP-binding protein [Hymenobacter sp. 15J16-1T3B]